MKNVHLIPTDKPSRFYKRNSDSSFDFSTSSYPEIGNSKNQNIYITSDEEIKEGDWFLTDDKRVEKCAPDWRAREWHKKIILTTDPQLIADGVQAIDDEFLEFIVKNPSCEEIEIANDLKYFNVDELRERHLKGLPHLYSESIGYKIIIPQEEPNYNMKQEILDEMKKQETLEEVVNNFKKTDVYINEIKQEQERMYSESDMNEFAMYVLKHNVITPKEWFEKFKNK
jgi:hypothetical protein